MRWESAWPPRRCSAYRRSPCGTSSGRPERCRRYTCTARVLPLVSPWYVQGKFLTCREHGEASFFVSRKPAQKCSLRYAVTRLTDGWHCTCVVSENQCTARCRSSSRRPVSHAEFHARNATPFLPTSRCHSVPRGMHMRRTVGAAPCLGRESFSILDCWPLDLCDRCESPIGRRFRSATRAHYRLQIVLYATLDGRSRAPRM